MSDALVLRFRREMHCRESEPFEHLAHQLFELPRGDLPQPEWVVRQLLEEPRFDPDRCGRLGELAVRQHDAGGGAELSCHLLDLGLVINWPCFGDVQGTAVELSAIELLDRDGRLERVCHFDKAEPSAATAVGVPPDGACLERAPGCKWCCQTFVGRLPRQSTYEDSGHRPTIVDRFPPREPLRDDDEQPVVACNPAWQHARIAVQWSTLGFSEAPQAASRPVRAG